MWEAQDANGDIYRYSHKPEVCGDQWIDMGVRSSSSWKRLSQNFGKSR